MIEARSGEIPSVKFCTDNRGDAVKEARGRAAEIAEKWDGDVTTSGEGYYRVPIRKRRGNEPERIDIAVDGPIGCPCDPRNPCRHWGSVTS